MKDEMDSMIFELKVGRWLLTIFIMLVCVGFIKMIWENWK